MYKNLVLTQASYLNRKENTDMHIEVRGPIPLLVHGMTVIELRTPQDLATAKELAYGKR